MPVACTSADQEPSPEMEREILNGPSPYPWVGKQAWDIVWVIAAPWKQTPSPYPQL